MAAHQRLSPTTTPKEPPTSPAPAMAASVAVLTPLELERKVCALLSEAH
jgi:hypothetical protein